MRKVVAWTAGVLAIFLSVWGLAERTPIAANDGRQAAVTTHTVRSGKLTVVVSEQGTLESSRNAEIKCEIRGGYGGRGGHSTVTWVIPSGSTVAEGDELVRLDTKVIEETVSLGKTDTNIAKAQLARTKADVSKAKIAIDAYLKGRYRSQIELLQNQKKTAERNLRLSEKILGNSQDLFTKGYVTKLEVEGNQFAVREATLELEVTNTEIDVLSRLTKAMQMETLQGNLVATQARLKGRTAGLQLEQGRLDLAQEEFAKSTIRAPQAGLVIYPSTAKWKDTPDVTEGASVRNNQVLLLMPDLTQMQVSVGIHESIVHRVHAGSPVRVQFAEGYVDTIVDSVASVASPAGWWSGNTVRYETTVKLPMTPEAEALGLKPGMTADVQITLAEHDDVLTIPLTAVVETDEAHYCWIEHGTKSLERRTVELGDSNEQFIIVRSGIGAGNEVVNDPLATVSEAKFLAGSEDVVQVKRGDLRATLTEQGTLESGNSEKIKCRVRGASTINWVVESGTRVLKGDELVRLENKQIEEYLHERTKFAYLSEDAAVTHRAQANRAKLAIQEYLEGRYRKELLTLEKDLAILEASLRSVQNILVHTKRVAESGYANELEVREKEFAVTRAQLALEAKKAEIEVLNDFTKDEELTNLRGEWAAAVAAADGHEEVLALDRQRIALAQAEMERCVIRADRDGLVIYPKSKQWKRTPDIVEGATVHKDQTLLLMPDLSQMQVKVGIHETMIDRVKPGMVVHVRVPNGDMMGSVVSVASAAQPTGWWRGNMVKYDTIVELPQQPGLMPGMSAEVEIVLAEYKDQLLIPISAVVETDEGTYCWVDDPQKPQRREITIGDSNTEFAVVLAGLEEGESIVRDASTMALDVRSL